MFWVQLVLAGIATGCIYALAGMGLVLTYKATGVFNFAQGAIAMLVAYVMWETAIGWHWPLWLAASFTLLVFAPAVGVILERFVFRPLGRRRASAAERLVATLGVFLVCFGLAFQVWTGKVRHGPRLISNRAVHIAHGLTLGVDQMAIIVITLMVSVGLWLMFRRTHLGTEIRAVVDRRELAELASINANRVSALSWAMGCILAGITGVLLAPDGLDPFHLTLLVIETFSIAVLAGLTSLPIAVGAGILVLGVGSSLLLQFNPEVLPLVHTRLPQGLISSLNSLKPNLSVIVLFVALIVMRKLDEPADTQAGAGAQGSRGLISASLGRVRNRSTMLGWVMVAGFGILLPFLLNDITIARGQTTLGLVVVFTSIVCITGFCGYITLGQAGFAGFGAFVAARLATSFHLPSLLVMILGALGAVVVGLIAGYPALKRRGLFLGLTTLTIGLLLYNFVFNNSVFTHGGLGVNRPSMFGVSFEGDRAFYFFELAWVGLMLLLARNLRSGRLGRILAAMRDSEVAAQSIGIDQRKFKLFIFAASAFIAGIGGVLLSQQSRAFTASFFDPITSLLWFTIVIVAGVGSLGGAVLGAALYEILSVVLPHRLAGVSTIIIAVAAITIGYLPGGSLMGLGRRLGTAVSLPKGALEAFRKAQAASAATPASPGATRGATPAATAATAVSRARAASAPRRDEDLVASAFAERVLEVKS